MFKLTVSSSGNVELELDSIPTIEEKNQIESMIAPDGFIMAEFLKKLVSLAKPEVKETPAFPIPAAQPYRPVQQNLGTCPKCGAIMKMSKAGKKYCSALCWQVN